MSIELLSLLNFKCHGELDLPLAPLTVLTGLNSAGKSTVCQSLALLAQSLRVISGTNVAELQLNGELVTLGSIGDVINQSAEDESFEIRVRSDADDVAWRFEGRSRTSRTCRGEVTCHPADGRSHGCRSIDPGHIGSEHGAIGVVLENLVYLTMSRLSTAVLESVTTSEDDLRVGPSGEGALALLHYRDQSRVSEALCIENVPPVLPRQVEAWMGIFFPGFAMDIQPVDSAVSMLILKIRTDLAGEFHPPANVGFGPYYALPVVTAALNANPGDLLIFDSPEAHLHPLCQARMGRFLAQVADTGVQIIVETHNDHFINGVRQAVKDEQLPPDAVIVHFFGQGDAVADASHKHSTIHIAQDGALDHWPAGFCDQYEQDLARLTGWE